MRPSDYLESRYVASQLRLQEKKDTRGHGYNQAILALLWINLKIETLICIGLIVGHYLLVLLHILPAPKPARSIVRDAALAKQAEQEQNAKMAKDIIKGAIDGNKTA